MKVLFSCGNAPGLPTGYGGQGLLVLEALQKLGAEVHVLAWNLSQPQFNAFQCYSTEEMLRLSPIMKTAMETNGSERIQWGKVGWYCNPYTTFPHPIRKQDLNKLIVQSDADLFLALQDIFMFEPGPFLCLSAVWMPLHFIPVEHPTVLSLADFDIQLPISGWGSMLLQPLQAKSVHKTPCLRHIEVIGHGRNIEVFKPAECLLLKDNDESMEWEQHHFQLNRKETRKFWNWPQDAFVVLLIASNSEESGRKAFDAQLQAFVEFSRKNPKAWLHIHAEVARAYDLPRLLETFGGFDTRSSWIDYSDHRARTFRESVVYGKNVSISNSSSLLHLKESELIDLYHASDVLLAATCSEGCGVPILEAQLCGIPVVTTRATAMWEETMFGISVKPAQWIARMDFNSGWYLPDSKGIGSALHEIMQWSDKDRRTKFQSVYRELIKQFSNESIVQRWGEVLSKVKDFTFADTTSCELLLDKERLVFLKVAVEARKLWRKAYEADLELTSGIDQAKNKFKEVESIRYLVSTL